MYRDKWVRGNNVKALTIITFHCESGLQEDFPPILRGSYFQSSFRAHFFSFLFSLPITLMFCNYCNLLSIVMLFV